MRGLRCGSLGGGRTEVRFVEVIGRADLRYGVDCVVDSDGLDRVDARAQITVQSASFGGADGDQIPVGDDVRRGGKRREG